VNHVNAYSLGGSTETAAEVKYVGESSRSSRATNTRLVVLFHVIIGHFSFEPELNKRDFE